MSDVPERIFGHETNGLMFANEKQSPSCNILLFLLVYVS